MELATVYEAFLNEASARDLMNSGVPWVNYVNEVVLRDMKPVGISIDATYKVNTPGFSALELLSLFKRFGWSWPRAWYRRNRNPVHRSGIHLENQVESGRWIHLIIVPQVRERPVEHHRRLGADPAPAWNLSPLRVDLHAENRWFQPSSAAHFCDFIKESYILPFLR